MRVVYLLNGAALYGGVKVVLQHARALRREGVDATVVSPDPPPQWFPELGAGYRRVESLDPAVIGAADVAVGTIWFTVPSALCVPGAVACHLCQCYEAQYHGVADLAPQVDDVYRLRTFKLAVSPHLVELLRSRFGMEAAYVPQPFEPDLFHPPRAEREPDGRLRLLLAGQWELDIKGVEWGMRALRPLQEEGWLQLVRLSQDAPPAETAFWPEAERHVSVPPSSVPDIFRGVDAYVGLSSEVEGFGLPMLEAMGCARACVLTDIGAVRALDPERSASLRVSYGDAETLRAAVRRLRDDAALRRVLGSAGRSIALRFGEERTARALIEAFSQALSARAPASLSG
ncbi:MAG TPA: glycosyltransferase family 4 protein [Thermoanaerobaculia bacterium]|nr:glycosyltransferase family 4 protein [Thermoanaerobaculia bacterium]